MTDARFLVFARADRHEWRPIGEPQAHLSTAVRLAQDAIERPGKGQIFDRAQVIEVGGTDAIPSFTYRFGARSVG